MAGSVFGRRAGTSAASSCSWEVILMLPLEGITIISLEQAVAAPFAHHTRLPFLHRRRVG
jgi:hypothetical protein